MADYENPFASPFDDPSVQSAQTGQNQNARSQPEFNPFAGQDPAANRNFPPPPPSQQPAQVGTTSQGEAGPYAGGGAWQSKAAVEELQRRQDELERRAAEIDRREQEMQRNVQAQERRNNFPPLPGICPLQPCFYHDISVDIPLEFQKLVRTLYYGWMAYVGLLLLNVFGALTYFITSSHQGLGDNHSGVTFGLSILYVVLFTPCSFVCWFRPVYNAFRTDSSFNFFLFFFIFFFQFCVCVIQCIAIKGWGTVGIISSLDMFTHGSLGASAAGGIMFIIGVMFGAMAAFDLFMLIRVHRIYRSTGASFAKAQSEFAQGVMSNRTVQGAASNMAASAAQGAMSGGRQ